jgi:hypothetical protein
VAILSFPIVNPHKYLHTLLLSRTVTLVHQEYCVPGLFTDTKKKQMAQKVRKLNLRFHSRLSKKKCLLPVRFFAQVLTAGERNQNNARANTPKSAIPHSTAWRTTFEPVNKILNEPDPKEKDRLSKDWLINMEKHLNIMIITASPLFHSSLMVILIYKVPNVICCETSC